MAENQIIRLGVKKLLDEVVELAPEHPYIADMLRDALKTVSPAVGKSSPGKKRGRPRLAKAAPPSEHYNGAEELPTLVSPQAA